MSRHRNRFEQYGPDGPFDDRTGNEIVNNGPDSALSGGPGAPEPGGAGAGSDGSAGGAGLGGPGDLREGLGGEEAALRRLLHGVVEDLEPSNGALDHLRRAVPARRARKRQALVGMAAAALLIGTAVPAFVHVAGSGGSDGANPVNAGHGEQAQGGTGEDPGVAGGGAGTDDPSAGGRDDGRKQDGRTAEPGDRPTGAGDGPSGAAESSPGTTGQDVAVCDSARLGVVSAQTNAPDGEGKVYGTFRIANTSQADCVIGTGSVDFQAAGAADPARISVVSHVTGDAAGGLPDPSQEVGALLLKPSAAYEVKFAWVPSGTCPTTNPSPDSSPTDGDSSGAGTGTGSAGDNTAPQLVVEEGGTQDGSVVVVHMAQGGAASAQTTVPNACAGTIYRTGLLPGQ